MLINRLWGAYQYVEGIKKAVVRQQLQDENEKIMKINAFRPPVKVDAVALYA
ncbi:MAG: hypothetical protein Q4P12_01065 [Bacteroidales bacterium]|nr:hypothetical protein [Bacteroidales bacterium]